MSNDTQTVQPNQFETIDEKSSDEQSEDQLNTNDQPVNATRRQARLHSPFPPTSMPANINLAPESVVDEEEDENRFDVFILHNFRTFSGTEDVVSWLDETDKKFNKLKISRNLRYKAIPLLVEDSAKRTYLLNKSNIKTFDDFYECLLSKFSKIEQSERHQPALSLSCSSHNTNPSRLPNMPKNLSFNDTQLGATHQFDDSDSLPPRPILRSTAIADKGATSLRGDDSAFSGAFQSSNLSQTACSLDQTVYVIHKAIIDNLIKNPKIFQGGKDDVKQWLEDIEQLFDTAQIPDSHKLDLITYSLRGEARRWYKNTKSSLTSWAVFVQEIKEAFLSPFHEELAFKKLESYTQGANQPVRSFYNEVLKLCIETDPEMSESMKLRHLLKKAKSTLQYEIRKRKPTTTKQFLEYAKEAEELLQLSNIDTDTDTYEHKNGNPTHSVDIVRNSVFRSPDDVTGYPSYDRSRHYDNTRTRNRYYNNQGRNNNFRSPQSGNSTRPVNFFNSSLQRNNSTYPPNHSMNNTFQVPSGTSHNSNAHFRPYSPNTYSNSTYSSNSSASPATQNPNRAPPINHISATHNIPPAQLSQQASNPDIATPDAALAHQASAGPHF
ncbi:unnamed protein product [Adineta ricciae]|uniref:Retrotransposon gag domain-containing protein n=1 Tax=Adineta ricciae TaxID=249248 RepID=A0A815J8J3_ADIRI|nr:unnamed protein product [Adineta ricciae]CAF1510811.1 unnamed protein product [Adineta ricciae]